MIARAEGSKFFQRQVAYAACLFIFLTVTVLGVAQDKIYRPPPNYVHFGKPDQAEGRRVMEDSRQRWLPDMYWEFELRVMPHRGEDRVVPARLWLGHNEKGPVWRVEISPDDPAKQQRLLVQNGPQSALWSWQPSPVMQPAKALGQDGLFDRIADTDLTPFDLQMPFLYWNDFVYEDVARVRGRPAYQFLMYPPADIAAQHPGLCGVRVYLDTQFKVLVQAEQIGPNDVVLKSITILDLKKVDDQWIAKSIDFRDEETRNKTRFTITRAAVKLDLLPMTFDVAELPQPLQPPPAGRIRNVGP